MRGSAAASRRPAATSPPRLARPAPAGPIITLKIDQSFVARLADDARDRAIVRTVIRLAHGLGMKVVAAGVESPAGLELLRQAGCDAVQDFLYAKPLPADEFIRFVHQRR